MTRLRLAALVGAALLAAGSAPAASSPAPSAWLTPELVAAVEAAGPAGVPLPRAALSKVATASLAFTGIRPGVPVTRTRIRPSSPGDSTFGGVCTANFVFQEATGAFDPASQLYLGSAGHCFELGDEVMAVVTAPGTTTPVLVEIGVVVVDTPNDAEDFAVIELDPALNDWVSPSVAHWGGPTGAYTGGAGVVVTFTGLAGVPRIGHLDEIGSTRFQMTTATVVGDSGAAVLTADGLAVGETRGLESAGDGQFVGAMPNGPTIAVMVDLAGAQLATCPTRTPWPLPGCPPV